jgi:hypothetical protein
MILEALWLADHPCKDSHHMQIYKRLFSYNSETDSGRIPNAKHYHEEKKMIDSTVS